MSALTLFFIVEPPEYQTLACYLAASARTQFGDGVTLVGYCPEHRMADLDPAALEALSRMNVDVRPMRTEGRFDPPYPHGNKLLACLEPRDTPYAGFVDSDVLFLRSNRPENLIAEGAVSLTPAASMTWGDDSLWPPLYAACGLEMPAERVRLLRQAQQAVLPYFSSGLVIFPDGPQGDGKRFAEHWMEVAQIVDALEIDNKRPYLDQMTLPLAIRRAGLGWSLLPEEQHFILGGKLRGTPFPEDRGIYTVHYRQWKVLKEAGLSNAAKDMLKAQAGVKKLEKLRPATGTDG